jgi:hypothetical protein
VPPVPATVRAANWINLSTPLGLLLTAASGARPRTTPDGLYVATGYRWPFPDAGAFVVGSVILTSAARSGPEPSSPLGAEVWQHERRHVTQYAWCLGLPFIPAYCAAAGASWLIGGDPWTYNVFERRAGLAAGGYPRGDLRPAVAAVSNRLRRRGSRRSLRRP